MDFSRILRLSKKPEPYESGTSVMWTDPYISKKLLDLHINPDNDMASRKDSKIDLVVEWILSKARKRKLDILDLGCGPGLYAEKFALKGHRVTGIDFSENSIQYARQSAKNKELKITYEIENYLEMDYDNQVELVIMIYLDFCVLKPDDPDRVLANIYKSLRDGGQLIIDVVNEKNIDKKIIPQSWEASASGFWRDIPYIALTGGFHYPEKKLMSNQHVVLGSDGRIDSYIFWNHYFERQDLVPILERAGLRDIKNYENVLPAGDCWNGENVTFYVSEKQTIG